MAGAVVCSDRDRCLGREAGEKGGGVGSGALPPPRLTSPESLLTLGFLFPSVAL